MSSVIPVLPARFFAARRLACLAGLCAAFVTAITPAHALQVTEVEHASQAHVRVFKVPHASQADLKIHWVEYASQARGDALWFRAQHVHQAELKIHFVRHASQADLKIFEVEFPSQAGWNGPPRGLALGRR